MSQEARHHLLHLKKKPRNILSLHFSRAKESQINADCYGYTMGCMQQLNRIIGRVLSDLHEQDNILFCKEIQITGTRKTCKESQGMSEISSLKNNRNRKNKLKFSQKSLCYSESLLPIATILNSTFKVEVWVNFKTVLVDNDELGSQLVVVFSTPEEKKLGNDNDPLGSLLSSTPEEKKVENDNKPKGSLSSSTIEAKQPKTMRSWDPSLLSSFALEEKTKRRQ